MRTRWRRICFSSFVFVAVFVVVNLFIAVVLNNLDSVKHEQQVEADRDSANRGLLEAIEAVRQRLEELEERLRTTPPGKVIGRASRVERGPEQRPPRYIGNSSGRRSKT